MVHFNNFPNNPGSEIPESIKAGTALFYLQPNLSSPILSSKNAAHTKFAAYWKQISLLDVNIWQRWMHTHRINLVLEHDMPLPKHLHMSNNNGRYLSVQCRQAQAALSVLLRNYSSFVMLENVSYIKIIQRFVSQIFL